MKFGLLLASHRIEEWLPYYIAYDALKKQISEAAQQLFAEDKEDEIENEADDDASTVHGARVSGQSIIEVNKDHWTYRWCGCCINLLVACLACRCCHRRPDNDVITMYDHKSKRPKRHVHNHKNDKKFNIKTGATTYGTSEDLDMMTSLKILSKRSNSARLLRGDPQRIEDQQYSKFAYEHIHVATLRRPFKLRNSEMSGLNTSAKNSLAAMNSKHDKHVSFDTRAVVGGGGGQQGRVYAGYGGSDVVQDGRMFGGSLYDIGLSLQQAQAAEDNRSDKTDKSDRSDKNDSDDPSIDSDKEQASLHADEKKQENEKEDEDKNNNNNNTTNNNQIHKVSESETETESEIENRAKHTTTVSMDAIHYGTSEDAETGLLLNTSNNNNDSRSSVDHEQPMSIKSAPTKRNQFSKDVADELNHECLNNSNNNKNKNNNNNNNDTDTTGDHSVKKKKKVKREDRLTRARSDDDHVMLALQEIKNQRERIQLGWKHTIESESKKVNTFYIQVLSQIEAEYKDLSYKLKGLLRKLKTLEKTGKVDLTRRVSQLNLADVLASQGRISSVSRGFGSPRGIGSPHGANSPVYRSQGNSDDNGIDSMQLDHSLMNHEFFESTPTTTSGKRKKHTNSRKNKNKNKNSKYKQKDKKNRNNRKKIRVRDSSFVQSGTQSHSGSDDNTSQAINNILSENSNGSSNGSLKGAESRSCADSNQDDLPIANTNDDSPAGDNNEDEIHKTLLLEPLKMPTNKSYRNIHMYQLKLNVFILYHRLIALSNFASLNRIGFKKICKKFDKNLHCKTQKELMSKVDGQEFVMSERCSELIKDLMQMYADLFEKGNIDKAKVKLLDSISWHRWSTRASFNMGLKMGLIVGLVVWCLVSLLRNTQHLPHHCMYVYRACGCFIWWLWIWGFDVFIWSKYRINYVFIFEFDPRTRLTFAQYLDEAANLSIYFFLNVIVYVYTAELFDDRYAVVLPASLLVFLFLKTIFPIFDHWLSRKCMLEAIFQTIIAPCGRVRFRDFFMGDVLTSMVKVLADLYMASCLLLLGQFETPANQGSCHYSKLTMWPIIICLPYWFRFMQCINRYFATGDRMPHLANAFKYALAMSVTLLGALHSTWVSSFGGSSTLQDWTAYRILWLVLTATSTLYTFYWDVKMDWKLFPFERSRYKEGNNDPFFGRFLEYPAWWYVVAIPTDLLLRFSWTFTLTPTVLNPYFENSTLVTNLVFVGIVELLELTRRGMWAIFRVENAHVSRRDEFRSYDYVPLLYEHMNLVDSDSKSKAQKPKSLIAEIVAIIALVVVIAMVIWATQ